MSVKDILIGIENEMRDAFNHRDVDTILKHFSSDILGFSSTKHERFQGLDDLRKTFQYYLDEAEKVSYEFTDPIVQDLGNVAIISYYWKVILYRGGKTIEIPGRGTHVFQKMNGEWKIVHEHFSKAH